ncbi:hypothetical protein HPB51_020699 [Rhipicephalus microplus]|uniref:Uncharacterized protein n=1 Tax=Rhipicephalus microplus TaxID=6941 RepID=A0A9J6EUR9_RHIMP|nr:hypothetical protein HPB51_020699 [Rhipicephalus microplus]
MLLTFKGPHVPTWIYVYNARHHCTLYKKMYEGCHRCSEQGYTADVWASTVVKCRGCAIANPPSDYKCVPTCHLCGKQHIREIYKTLYIIERHQREALREEEESKQQDQATQRRVTRKRSIAGTVTCP